MAKDYVRTTAVKASQRRTRQQESFEKLGEELFYAVTSAIGALDDNKTYPTIQRFEGKGREADGVFLQQGISEIWLTAKQARKLLSEIQQMYPNKDK